MVFISHELLYFEATFEQLQAVLDGEQGTSSFLYLARYIFRFFVKILRQLECIVNIAMHAMVLAASVGLAGNSSFVRGDKIMHMIPYIQQTLCFKEFMALEVLCVRIQ